MGARARASAPNHAERPSSKPLPLFRKPGASRAVACPCPMRRGAGNYRSVTEHTAIFLLAYMDRLRA